MFENEVTMRIKSRSVSASRKSPNEFAERLFAPLPGRYNRLAALLSFGQDPRWRAAMVDQMVASHPQSILDVACGPCAVTKRLVRKTSAHVVGLDLSPEMLHQGHVNVQRAGVQERVSLVRGRGEQLPFPDASFDALTFTYLLRYVADPQAALIELARVVKPGGRIASLEFAVPENRGWRWSWWLYTRLVLPVAGYATGGRAWWEVGRFLGPSISKHYKNYSLAWTLDAWRNAGIEHVEYRTMSLGGGVVIWGYRTI
jgi:demethylmenaquinone methyltransferase/2-methoxy-6-polyprenyl-1,4-benzoquinol methylase